MPGKPSQAALSLSTAQARLTAVGRASRMAVSLAFSRSGQSAASAPTSRAVSRAAR